jgi:hypothetical protein
MSDAVRILAIDCGRTSGITCEMEPDIPTSTAFEMGPKLGSKDIGISYGPAFLKFYRHVKRLAMLTETTLLVYESPLPVGGAGRGFTTTMAGLRVLYGLPAIIEMLAAELGIECAEVNVQKVKKSLTGNAHATKEDVGRAVKLVYPHITTSDHNALDSTSAWHMAKCLRVPSYQPGRGPLFR